MAVRGRDAETRLVGELLRQGRRHSGSVLLIEGEPGMGKSVLLASAAQAATALGYATVTTVADEFERLIPLGPLLLALGDVTDPADDELDYSTDPDPRMRVVGRVRYRLESLLATGPVLVTADDLQYADPVTLLALRVLPRQLAATPLTWILARSPDDDSDAARLFDLLHNDGARLIRLQPLPAAAIAELITDSLGVSPDESLLSLASGAGGNPFLVGELLDGLREEDLLMISPTRATVAAERIPERVQRFVQRQISAVQPRTRHLIEVAAVLGRSFAVEDVAEMLGQPPAAALPAINEALASRIFVVDGETLSFRDTMTWRGVTESIPRSLSRALHRQYAQLLRDRGNTLQAAAHLIEGARQDDSRMLQELDLAARELLPRSPQTAADLAVHALELTSPEDPGRADRVVAAVRSLIAARRIREAMELADASLAAPLSVEARSQLRYARLAILFLLSRPDEARAEAEALLAEPGLPDRVRDAATVALLRALGELPDQALAEELASGVIRRADQAGGLVLAAAKALRATLAWNAGDIAAGLALSREAVSGSPDGPRGGQVPFFLLLEHAVRLTDARQFDEALALISVPNEDDDPVSLAMAQAGPALIRARIHLAEGRIDSAVSEAEAALGVGPISDEYPAATLAQCMLGTIALRRGDLAAAGRWLDRVATPLETVGFGRPAVTSRLLAAQVAGARDGAAAAMSIAGDMYAYVRELRWPLISDPGVPPQLVRLALAVGDDQLAAGVGGVIDEVGQANPAFPAVTAACAHALGLLNNDVGLLRLAAETQPDRWASASAAEDLGLLLAAEGRVSDAITWFDGACDNFQEAGASRDAARVRGRLRRLGVRRRQRRGATAGRRQTGADTLTATERAIAELASQGLTNQEIAKQTFISANTVAFHLRNIYRKLGIASRVQLARIVPGNG
jgi:DNA-binding CsgD family transcriptional regulator